jgi:hypothetical protein
MKDVGWWDPGFNGGGEPIGSATPLMDRLAYEGLNLTPAYSTPSCSPSRATIHTGQNPLQDLSPWQKGWLALYIFPSLEMCKKSKRKENSGGRPMSGTIGIVMAEEAGSALELEESQTLFRGSELSPNSH